MAGLQTGGLKPDLLRRLEEEAKKNSDVSRGGDVDSRGTKHVPKDNAAWSSRAKKPVALETLRIYLKDYCLEDSNQYSDSEMVQDMFRLVWYSEQIGYEDFGAELRKEERHCDKESKAERSYNLHLKRRAVDLAGDCSQTKMRDRSEQDWVVLLAPQVFRSFIQSADDKGYTDSRAHYCLACRCDFEPNSRPQARQTENTKESCGGTRNDLRYCTSTKSHFNLPNCDNQMNLPYYDDDGKVTGKNNYQKPDSTFGLCTYSLKEKSWIGKDWPQVDMVKLFEKTTLEKTLRGFPELGEPYKIRGDPVGVYSYPMFAFGLWEAKKDSDSSHENALKQSARKLKSLLSWQRRIFNTSEVRVTSPTVWFFSSIGADWRVYGCSETKSVDGDGFDYPIVHLWSGVSRNTKSALQLLSIVDLIRFWVDYTYKPLIGACISRLEAKKANKEPTPLNCTLWKLRIAINPEQTPWFFSQRHLKVSSSLIDSTNKLGVPHYRRHRSHSPSSGQSLQPENQLSPQRGCRCPTPASEQSVMPEKAGFNWLLDRDPGEEDLILIRISEEGQIMIPVIIYSTNRLAGEGQMPMVDWKDDNFKAVVAIESRIRHPHVFSIFSEDEQGRNYLWQYYRHKTSLIHQGVQFSMILPVNVVSYEQQNPESRGAQVFEPLESLLPLHDLLRKIERANRKWCSCGKQKDEYGPSMIQCRNALCKISWFHKACVSFPDSDDEDSDVEDSWLCGDCKKTPENKRAFIKSRRCESMDVFAQASCERLHLARAIEKVWCKHVWPSQDEIVAKIKEAVDKVDIIESATYTISKDSVGTGLDLPGYWAISKDKPKKLILAWSRKESRHHHESLSDEEDKNEDANVVGDFEEETDYYTAEDE